MKYALNTDYILMDVDSHSMVLPIQNRIPLMFYI